MRSIKEMDKRLDEREQEIERLQKELDKTRLSELDKEYRISKAIEYIENYIIATDIEYILLNILKGE